MRGLRVHITGVVQGVGFRPFVHNLANRYKLKGWVRNTSAGVDIEVDGKPEALQAFLNALHEEAPALAWLEEFMTSFGPATGFTSFEIISSEPVEGAFQPISPDVAICDDCLHELFNPSDRRYRYPFINCTNCGPRFSIIKDIPYDRPKTTMAGFRMCPDCEREYRDPADRRFHAQPIACPVCGPRVWLEVSDAQARHASPDHQSANPPAQTGGDPLPEARLLLHSGNILAVKGLGGFHLACDAENSRAVIELRNRKNRVDKPFAIMMPDLATIEKNCQVNELERELLKSSARPIVLLRRKTGSKIARDVAPGQDYLGVMLPYTPLHYLLFSEDGGSRHPSFSALVMTSGNRSEEPIATDNDEARTRLASLADAFLMHDRDIYIRCDDSVMRIFAASEISPPSSEDTRKDRESNKTKPTPGATRKTKIDLQKSTYPLRRSRGYSPYPVKLPASVAPLIAVGPELKNTFCMTNRDYAFLSHHIGDMENYETLRSFEEGIKHFEKLFRVKPEALAHDLHPDYLSTRYAIERGRNERLPTLGIQHHHAHVAACMAEHGMDTSRTVIGVAFDGTGFGEDGAIWGGEILVAGYKDYVRAMHLAYFPLPGGDAAIKKPARSALAILWSLGMDWDEKLAPTAQFSREELTNLRIQMEHRINSPLTSSAGRLFDAAAALAGGRQIVNYEAQAAIEFEALADSHEAAGYSFEVDTTSIQPKSAIEALIRDVLSDTPLPIVSARFHNGVAESVRLAVKNVKAETGLNEVILSGGVWQNITLLRRTLSLLQIDGFIVYLHRDVPTNDGGLSLGQAVIAAHRLMG